MNQAAIGQYIAGKRTAQGMTQEQLAQKIGVSQKSLMRWETGKRLPDADAVEALCTALGREPTLEELAAQIGVSCEEAAASMAADSPVESLSAPASAGEETGLLLQDRIAGETAENEVLLDRMLLGDLLKMLNGRQREIIVRHYFYDQTQTQIAAQLGISQVQVSRIERKILGQMRAKLEET